MLLSLSILMLLGISISSSQAPELLPVYILESVILGALIAIGQKWQKIAGTVLLILVAILSVEELTNSHAPIDYRVKALRAREQLTNSVLSPTNRNHGSGSPR